MMSRRPGEGEGATLSPKNGLESGKRSLSAPVAGLPGARPDRCRRVEAMLPKPCIDPREVNGAPPHDREGVGESIAFAAGGEPFSMGILKKVEIALVMHLKERLQAMIDRRLGRADCTENGIDTALVLRSGMQLAVEKFGSRSVGSLPLVPEEAHRRGLAA